MLQQRPTRQALGSGRSPRSLRAAAWALWALAALIVYGAQLAHWVLLSHSVCVAHGELVHDEPAGHAHAPAAHDHGDAHRSDEGDAQQVDGASDHSAAPALSQSSTEDDDHGHCDAVSDDGADCACAEPALTALLSWDVVASRPHLFAARSKRLFLLAPKTSPPRVS